MIYNITRLDSETTWGIFDESTEKFKQKYGQCSDKWVPALDAKTGKRRTGLEEKLPLKECKKLKLPEDSLKQHKFEKLLNLEEGELSPNSKYWSDFMIIIPVDGLQLNDQIDYDEFKLELLRADKQIAKGLAESNTSTKFQYVITTIGAEAKVENTKRETIAKAYAKYATMTQSDVEEVMFMYGQDPMDVEPEVCRNIIGNKLEANPKKFLAVVGDAQFKEKIKLIKMIKEGVVRKGAAAVGFDVPLFFGDILLGKGLDEAIDFLLDKENSSIYVGLNKAYEAAIKE